MLAATLACAHDWRTCHADIFRAKLRHLVSQGNLQYDRSYRRGIALYADSLRTLLLERQATGTLEHNDSIEFWAHWHKLCGDWFYEDGNYNEYSFELSENHFNEALQIFRQAKNNIFENKVSAVPIVHRELAQLCYRLKRYKEALRYTQQAYNVYSANARLSYLYDDDILVYNQLKSQLAICNARLGNTELALKQIDSLIADFPKNSDDYYETLRKKGKILMLDGKAGCANKALPLYKEYLKFRMADALSTLDTMTVERRQDYWMRIRPFVADCYQLENADPAFLYDVTLFAKGLLLQLNRLSGQGRTSDDALAPLKYTWRQIQAKLAKDACAIEFVQYEKDGEQKMAALVLKKTGSPQWVEMMSPEDVLGYMIDGISLEERLSNTNGSIKNVLYNDSLLACKIWNAQLVASIGNMQKVYFAPDGYLHQLAIEYMPAAQMANCEFYRLTSTRRLMEDATVDIASALIVGGVRYDESQHTASNTANDAEAYGFMRSIGATFNYLPGSKHECDSIYSARKVAADKYLTGTNATEQAFLQHGKDYSIINISTHGYFAAAQTPQGTDIKPCVTDETLSQSILALAGANVNIKNDHFNTNNADGILSAKELSNMDLSTTRLAIISACQTGLGHITADGVYGIQRGLKNAGVGALLVSLWNVDDQATCLLMTQLHKNLLTGMSYHKAFTQARRHLMQTETVANNKRSYSAARHSKPKKTHKYNKPQYSDAFILIDAIN